MVELGTKEYLMIFNLVLSLQYLFFSFLNRITTNRVSVMIIIPNKDEDVKADQLYNIHHMLNDGRESTTAQLCNSQKHLRASLQQK